MNEYKHYSIGDKYRYFCKQSKVGARDNNGRILSDFERGVFFQKAKTISMLVELHKRNQRNYKSNVNSGMDIHSYSENELNSLYDNFKDINL